MNLIFICGLPGAGKLTVAKELAKLTGYRLFHNHLTVDLLLSVFEFGSEPFKRLRERIWLDTFAEAADSGIEGMIFTFTFDYTVSGDIAEKARQTIESRNGEAFFVELSCDEAELKKRIENPSRKAFGKLSSSTQFEELSNSGAFPTFDLPDNQLIIDVSKLSPQEAADFIYQAFSEDS